MNAFNDILGFAGNAADAVLLGGAVGKTRRRNAFADMVEQGDLQGAQNFATRHGRDDLAARVGQQAQAQQQGAQQRQQDQAAVLGRIAQYGDSLPPEARLGYAQSIAPILQSQFDLDDEDVQAIMQAAQVPQGFGALAAAFIDPNQQVQNRFEDRKITETGRSNRATEGLRRGELGVSQGNLALNRDKFGEDQRQFDVAQQAKQQPTEIDDAAIRTASTWISARNALLNALQETNTFPGAGAFPATTHEAQTAEGAVAALAPVLKQIFRVAGEGVFTDRDQALLLEMVPDRNDHKRARLAKIENINRIISSKLGVNIPFMNEDGSLADASALGASPGAGASPQGGDQSDPLGIR